MSDKHYFSVIKITDTGMKSPHFRRESSDVYGIHQQIWNLFPSITDQNRDFLFRVIDRKFPPSFYLLSKREPIDERNYWEIKTKEFSPQLNEGTRLFFSLKANARITRKEISSKKGGKNPPKHDIFMDAKEQYRKNNNGKNPLGSTWRDTIQKTGYDWIGKQSKKHGFQLESVRIESCQQQKINRKGKNITFNTADFEGILNIQNPEKFLKMLFKGLGSSKSFGCGLMLVRKI